MHKRIACHRCGVFEDLGCGCTSTQLAIQAELEMDAFEKQHAKGSWTDKQMVNHLRENGYRVEKRSPNPKKRKRAHRKLVQFKDY